MPIIKSFRLVLGALIQIGSLFSFGQTPKILQPLLAFQNGVSQIVMRTDTALFAGVIRPETPTLQFPETGRSFVKNGEGLFVQIDGSGRLYSVSDSAGAIKYYRIDSTSYSGNSFGSILFSYNNHIFSLGGYGFWRSNGQLRVFRGKKEGWEIVPLSEEVCISRGIAHFPWVDAGKGYLYVISKPEDFINQALNNWQEKADKENETRVMRLNLGTGTWEKQGIILKDSEWKYKVIGNSPWGLLVEKGFRDLRLFDFRANELKAIKKQKADSLNTLFAGMHGMGYFLDSTFYFGDLFANTVDSLKLSYGDFERTGDVIWTVSGQNAWTGSIVGWAILILSGIAVSVVVGYFIKRTKDRKRSDHIAVSSEWNQPISIERVENKEQGVFTQVEKMLIGLVAVNAQNGQHTSIDEINKVLGVTNKNLPTQKRTRSEVISAINEKAVVQTGSPVDLILRTRSVVDGRQIEYFVDESLIQKALEWSGD
jgi:hypothetical protein